MARQLALISAFTVLVVSYQNCGPTSGFVSQTASSSFGGSRDGASTEPQPQPQPTPGPQGQTEEQNPVPGPQPGPIGTPTPATGKFYIVGKDVIDPDGNKFFPIGGNVGVESAFDWKGVANGRSADALAWGWNTVRLTVYCTDMADWTMKSKKGYNALLSQVDGIVSEYTGKKMVVMIECHDITGQATLNHALMPQIGQFWTDMAGRYKNNTYVWFNPLNEPVWSDNQTWVDLQKHFLQLVRKNGAENIFVADLINTGQDAGWDGAKKVFDPSMGPAVANGQCNVMFALHAYGGMGGEAEHSAYIDRVHAANLSLIVGEVGYAIDGSSTAGDYQSNVRGNDAIMKIAPSKGVGILWWHATHGDMYSLKKSGGAFYEGGAGANLSTAGAQFWNIGQNKPKLGKFVGKLAPSNCASAAGK